MSLPQEFFRNEKNLDGQEIYLIAVMSIFVGMKKSRIGLFMPQVEHSIFWKPTRFAKLVIMLIVKY
jgi:hypothetical protein